MTSDQWQVSSNCKGVVTTERYKNKSNIHGLIVCSFLLLLTTCHWSLATGLTPGSFYADGKKDKKAIALTFDDGPGRAFTTAILDILDKYKIKATFFMSGDQAEIRKDMVREVLKRGHEIGDHTYSHVNFYAYEKKNGVERTKETVRREIKKSKDIIEKITGAPISVCRMPNGYNRSWLGEIAKEFGYTLVNWTFGEDWLLKKNADVMAQDYEKHISPGAILLMHDGGSDRKKTAEILPRIIEEAQKKGYSFMKVSEILQD